MAVSPCLSGSDQKKHWWLSNRKVKAMIFDPVCNKVSFFSVLSIDFDLFLHFCEIGFV